MVDTKKVCGGRAQPDKGIKADAGANNKYVQARKKQVCTLQLPIHINVLEYHQCDVSNTTVVDTKWWRTYMVGEETVALTLPKEKTTHTLIYTYIHTPIGCKCCSVSA